MSGVRAGVLAAVFLLSACGGGGTPSGSPTSPGPTSPRAGSPTPSATGSAAPADLRGVRFRLVQVATLEVPLAMAVRTGDPALYIAEQSGRVVSIRPGSGAPAATVLDVASKISYGGEQGLLGLAFSPDGRFLYVNYTDTNGDTNVIEYRFGGGVADPATARRVLFVHQPYANHNGGNLTFGPDGYLYVGLGDGGSEGDPAGYGQSLGTLLGKMLRIDPRPTSGRGYGIPPDNPFVNTRGARPEIWAFGLRNPWRYSFDRQTGDLWIGDVGQDAWEEVDFQPADSPGGENYGWNCFEGSHAYKQCRPGNAVAPIYEYGHTGGNCVVTGGYVYRGTEISGLQGAYVFADFCVGRILALREEGGRVTQRVTYGAQVSSPASFGEDASGALYVMSLSGGVYRLQP